MYTVLDPQWWTINLSETCRVLFQNKFEKLVHLVGFYNKSPSWKLTCPQLVKTSPHIMEIRVFMTAFTSASHLPVPWATTAQSMPPHTIPWIFIFILSSHLRLGLPSVSFHHISQPKLTMYLSCVTYTIAVCDCFNNCNFSKLK